MSYKHRQLRPAIVQHDTTWKQELSQASIPVSELLHRLGLSSLTTDCDLQPDFRCLATASYINKMQYGKPDDPLLKQVLPLARESSKRIQATGLTDPVGDRQAEVSTGLLHKYHGRALMISTPACAVHCRYCFRRNYPYQQASITAHTLDQALDYLLAHPEIDEIILSGGDPLVMDNEKLQTMISRLAAVKQLQTLRIHSRIPVVLPARIDTALIDLLTGTRLRTVLVIHCNHANEIQHREQRVLEQLATAGVTLLNQSVLLRGINDQAATLIALSKRLHACRTLPYYLHSLDPVAGAMHFAVPQKQAVSLHQQITETLPGYLVPRLVREIPGKPSKTAISRI
jgi:EF-P beta-lysylation protein EpmB